MNKLAKSFSLNEGKIQASLLLKSLRSDDATQVSLAVKRFLRAPEFSRFTIDEFPLQSIQRRHALQVIAIERGFRSWPDLKCQLLFIRGGFLNQWFVQYEEGKAYQRSHGGFILPFKKQFFVCTTDYIIDLGFDVCDPDWVLIAHDWVVPQHKVAWQRLYKKWMHIQGAT
jgi:hypothetical protein